MVVNEFRVSQSALVAELQLLMMDVNEMKLDEDTAELIVDRATELIAETSDSVKEEEPDRIRRDLGKLQNVYHQAERRKRKLQKKSWDSSEDSRSSEYHPDALLTRCLRMVLSLDGAVLLGITRAERLSLAMPQHRRANILWITAHSLLLILRRSVSLRR